MAKAKSWNYSAGERGVNRVRVYQNAATRGLIYWDWYDRDVVDTDGKPKRVREALGHADRSLARAQAEQLATQLRARSTEPRAPRDLTLYELFDNYLQEVTPTKGREKQRHDHCAAQLFLRCFGEETLAKNLSKREWNRFIQERRSGALAPLPTLKPAGAGKSARQHARRAGVGDRAVAYDLRWLLAVLNWATMAGNGAGRMLLDRNPLKGLTVPREESPRRPALNVAQYEALRSVAAEVNVLFRLAVVLAHETGHRIGAIRQLQWADVDFDAGTVRWRKQTDKGGYEHTTPLTETAAQELRRALDGSGGPSAWVFPAPGTPDEACSRHLMRDWWERGARLAKLPPGERYGWHALRRQFATELKGVLPLRDLCDAGGWRDPKTVLVHYQRPDQTTIRQALANRTLSGRFEAA